MMQITSDDLYYTLKDYRQWLLSQYEIVLEIVDKHAIDEIDIEQIRRGADKLDELTTKTLKAYYKDLNNTNQ